MLHNMASHVFRDVIDRALCMYTTAAAIVGRGYILRECPPEPNPRYCSPLCRQTISHRSIFPTVDTRGSCFETVPSPSRPAHTDHAWRQVSGHWQGNVRGAHAFYRPHVGAINCLVHLYMGDGLGSVLCGCFSHNNQNHVFASIYPSARIRSQHLDVVHRLVGIKEPQISISGARR